MAVQAGDLRDRLEVWKAEPVTDENGDTDSVYQPLRTIWGNVTPSSGRPAERPVEAARAATTPTVTIRAPSRPAICRAVSLVVRRRALRDL